MRKFTKEEEDQIVSGNIKEVAKNLNISESTAKRARRRLKQGITERKRVRRNVSFEKVESIRKLWKSGTVTLEDLRKLFGIHCESIVYGKSWQDSSRPSQDSE